MRVDSTIFYMCNVLCVLCSKIQFTTDFGQFGFWARAGIMTIMEIGYISVNIHKTSLLTYF